MRWLWRRRKPGASEKGRERHERLHARKTVDPGAKTNEEILGGINYEPEAAPRGAGEITREAWGATFTIAVVLAGLLVLGVLAHVWSEARSSWTARQARPLVLAAEKGDLQELRKLIAEGADPNAAGRGGLTALIAAVRANNLDAVQFLLNHGAKATHGALEAAIRYDRRDMIIALVEAGADPNARSRWSAKSLLELAAEDDDVEMAEVLLGNGANANLGPKESPFATPALHIAVENEQVEFTRVLLEHGADPMLVHRGWSAAEIAVRKGNEELTALMRDAMRGD